MIGHITDNFSLRRAVRSFKGTMKMMEGSNAQAVGYDGRAAYEFARLIDTRSGLMPSCMAVP
jgi:hypothetical protein